MAIKHPFAVVYRWSEHGEDVEGGAVEGPDGRRHIHVEFEDGACVCVVQKDGAAESLTSNRLFVPVRGTEDLELVEVPDARED